MNVIELRCVENPHRLFAKLLMTERPAIVSGNLMEFSCRDCAKQTGAKRVLHRFNVIGELIETEMID